MRPSLDGLTVQFLVLRRTDVADGRVPATLVVEDLDVVEQLILGLPDRLEGLAELELHRRKPAWVPVIPVEMVPSEAGDENLTPRQRCARTGNLAPVVRSRTPERVAQREP